MSNPIDMNKVREAITMDPHIHEHEKNSLFDSLNDPNIFSEAAGGVAGALLGRTVSKFLLLDKTSQLLLSLAGVGLGVVLIKSLGKDQSDLVSYHNGLYKVKE